MPDSTQSFTKIITDSAAANWLGLAANLIQVGEFLFGGGPDIQDVLNKIDELSAQIAQDFFALRDLILRETARIIEEVDTQAQLQNLALASTAFTNLKEFRRSGNRDLLEMAYTVSAEASFFFLQLTSPSTIASFVYCVGVRIAVLRSFITPVYYSQPQYIDEISGYIRHLTDLIQDVVQSVEATHQTSQFSQSVGRPPNNGFFRDFWIHTQTIRLYSDQDPNAPDVTKTVELKRIEFQDESTPPSRLRTLPTEEEARGAIDRDRATGIQQELDFISIPQFITIRDNWNGLLDQRFQFGGGVANA